MRLSSTLSKRLFDSLLDSNTNSSEQEKNLEDLREQGKSLGDLLEFYPGLFPFEKISKMSKTNLRLLFKYKFPPVVHRKFVILPSLFSASFDNKKFIITLYSVYNDINICVEGKTLLDHALIKGDREVVQMLLQNGASRTSIMDTEGQLASDLGAYGVSPYIDDNKSVKSSLNIIHLRQKLIQREK